MNKNLRWKSLTILAVFAIFFTLGVYPILANRYKLPAPGWLLAKQLKLGLDLQGGVHLDAQGQSRRRAADLDRVSGRADARGAADRRRRAEARST